MSFRISRARNKRTTASLNLVSLMDIFTILVFFLLMNSGDTEQIEKASIVMLPESSSKQVLKTKPVITVSNESIMFEGKPVTQTALFDNKDKAARSALKQQLLAHTEKTGPLTEELQAKGRGITIMGDSSVPYSTLKQIIKLCSETDYRDISLAVSQVTGTVAMGASQ